MNHVNLPAKRTDDEQKALDYKMYNAFKENHLGKFKDALQEGANPNAHWEDTNTDNAHRKVYKNPTDNCFQGEHLIAQLAEGKPTFNSLNMMIALLEAGASLTLVQRPDFSVTGIAAMGDYDHNGKGVHPEKASDRHRMRLDLLFAAGGDLTPMDRKMLKNHRERMYNDAFLSYAECIGPLNGKLPDMKHGMIHEHYTLRPTAQDIFENHHIPFDMVKRENSIHRNHIVPGAKVSSVSRNNVIKPDFGPGNDIFLN